MRPTSVVTDKVYMDTSTIPCGEKIWTDIASGSLNPDPRLISFKFSQVLTQQWKLYFSRKVVNMRLDRSVPYSKKANRSAYTIKYLPNGPCKKRLRAGVQPPCCTIGGQPKFSSLNTNRILLPRDRSLCS